MADQLHGLSRDDLLRIVQDQAAQISDLHQALDNHRSFTNAAEDQAAYQRDLATAYACQVQQLQSAITHVSDVMRAVSRPGDKAPTWPEVDPDPVDVSVESARKAVMESIRVLDRLLRRIEGLQFGRPAGGQPGGGPG